MKYPRNEMREYLERLIQQFMIIDSLHRQLKVMTAWNTPKGRVALDIGSFFFKLSRYSIARTLEIELSAILSDREQRSLVDFLKKAHLHARSVKPMLYDLQQQPQANSEPFRGDKQDEGTPR